MIDVKTIINFMLIIAIGIMYGMHKQQKAKDNYRFKYVGVEVNR